MARSYTDLYPQLTAFGNLHHAFRKAARGKRGSQEVAAFEFGLESNLIQLQRELEEHTYRPGPYRSFYIQDPKQRLISAAPFRDRVVHHGKPADRRITGGAVINEASAAGSGSRPPRRSGRPNS